MPTSNHAKQILIGNWAFFCSQISKTTWNVLNCYVNLTNSFHVAVRLFSSRSQLTTKCGKNKKVAIRTVRPLRDNLSELRFLARFTTSLESQESYLTLMNLTLQITRDFLRLHSTFARLYNAAASPASRLHSAGSLAIILYHFHKLLEFTQ